MSGWARTGVALASRALPAGPERDRWLAEFRADLDVLAPRQQAGYTLGVLTHAWALRSALSTRRLPVTENHTTPPLLCRLNLRHHWRVVSAEDGHPHWECTSCRKLWQSARLPGDWSRGF